MFVLIFNNWGKKWQPSLFNYVQTSFLANCYFNIYFFFHGSGWGVVPFGPQTNESWMVEVMNWYLLRSWGSPQKRWAPKLF